MHQRIVLVSLPKFHTIDIEFSDVTFQSRIGFRGPEKQILKGVSGSFKSGELSAIMGPSGAGKSTLLNILTGFESKKWNGDIRYISSEGNQDKKMYRKQSCYIQQDDKLSPLFTVKEIMRIATALKIGSALSHKAKDMLIDDVLENLDLIKTKETRCAQLSGGQKKRLSIALELVDNPPVMFLDEPTTGLDALSSYQCIELLRNLAKTGRTIICTIHQPSAAIYEMFDNVYLLADGRCMYDGATKNTITYFANVGLHCPKYHNPADFMMEVISCEHGDYTDQLAALASNDVSWRSTTKTTDDASKKVPEDKAVVLIYPPSEMERFIVLMKRCAIQLFRDWTVTYLKALLHCVVGILLGLLYTNAGSDGSRTVSNVGFFLVAGLYLCYTSMMPAVLRFPAEFITLKKENFNNWYHLRTYYAATIVCTLPLQMAFTFIFSSITYFISHQPMVVYRFSMWLFALLMNTLIAESFGILIGTIFTPVNGTFFASIVLSAMLVLSGFLALFDHMPIFLYYLSYISYLRYTVHAQVHAIYGYGRETLHCPKSYCHYRIPDLIMTDLAMVEGSFWIDIAVLFINYLIFRFAAYCVLKKRFSST